jgi:hypothetical protein
LQPFYFHVFASGDFYADPHGFTCSSLYNARLHAIRLIKLIVDLAPSVYPWNAWSVIVAASDGAPVLAVPFAGHVRELVNARSKTLLQPRRSYPQVITYGDAGTLGAPANEQNAAVPRRQPVSPDLPKGNAPIARANSLPRPKPTRARRLWLARLLNRFNPRWLTASSARRFPLRPRASAR